MTRSCVKRAVAQCFLIVAVGALVGACGVMRVGNPPEYVYPGLDRRAAAEKHLAFTFEELGRDLAGVGLGNIETRKPALDNGCELMQDVKTWSGRGQADFKVTDPQRSLGELTSTLSARLRDRGWSVDEKQATSTDPQYRAGSATIGFSKRSTAAGAPNAMLTGRLNLASTGGVLVPSVGVSITSPCAYEDGRIKGTG